MDAAELRKRLTQSLLDEINDVQFPSVTMMNRVESTLGTQAELAGYIEALVEKVEEEQYPSIPMLNRLDGLLDRLEEVQQRQQLAAAQAESDSGD